jgi:hypothetical protein
MWDWMSVGGGDGFQTQIDPIDPNIFYTESQNAGIQRYNLGTGQSTSIKPRGGAGGGRGGGGGGGRAGGAGAGAAGAGAGAVGAVPPDPNALALAAQAQGGGGGRGGGGTNVIPDPPADTVIQFNWNSPIRLSPHNPLTVMLGGRQLFISRNRGDTWTMTQELGKKLDLTTRQIMGQSYSLPGCGRGGTPGQPCILSKNDGYVGNEYGTITELAESPVIPGIIWAGTDDGNVQLSKDMGLTWTEVGKNIPGVNHETYVSGLEASWFDAGTAYVALDAHRNDDLKPYIFKTTNYGQTWAPIASDLPTANVNSIRQDPVNRNLLFAPTEIGFYVSLNDGQSWSRFMPNLPVGRADEVLVHPREHDLILATHGHSVWIMDDITSLEQMGAPASQSADATLFKPRDGVLWKSDIAHVSEVPGNKWWAGENAPRGTAIAYQLKSAAQDVKVTVTDAVTGQAMLTCNGDTKAGLTRFQWAPGGGGGGGFGGGGAGAAGAPAAPAGPAPCGGVPGGGGGRGFGGGGGRGGGGGTAGTYRVTLTVNGKDVGSQMFAMLEDIWLNEK